MLAWLHGTARAPSEPEQPPVTLDELRELSSNGHERELRVFLNELLPEADLKYSQAPNPVPAGPTHAPPTGGVSAECAATHFRPTFVT